MTFLAMLLAGLLAAAFKLGMIKQEKDSLKMKEENNLSEPLLVKENTPQ